MTQNKFFKNVWDLVELVESNNIKTYEELVIYTYKRNKQLYNALKERCISCTMYNFFIEDEPPQHACAAA